MGESARRTILEGYQWWQTTPRVHDLYRAAIERFRRRQESVRRLAPVLEWVRTHLTEKLSLDEAARRVGVSVPRFTRLFRESAGVSFIHYVNHAHLQHAAALLRETALTVAEIAQQSGFSDQSYLDRLFRRAFHASPTSYRRQWRTLIGPLA